VCFSFNAMASITGLINSYDANLAFRHMVEIIYRIYMQHNAAYKLEMAKSLIIDT